MDDFVRLTQLQVERGYLSTLEGLGVSFEILQGSAYPNLIAGQEARVPGWTLPLLRARDRAYLWAPGALTGARICDEPLRMGGQDEDFRRASGRNDRQARQESVADGLAPRHDSACVSCAACVQWTP